MQPTTKTKDDGHKIEVTPGKVQAGLERLGRSRIRWVRFFWQWWACSSCRPSHTGKDLGRGAERERPHNEASVVGVAVTQLASH
jgi:hypothetical protein